MAPSPRPAEGPINRTPVYEEFISKLALYHQKRGTYFDSIPRVGTRLVDLKKLFDCVVDAGGYDKVCEIKLSWRKIGDSINLGDTKEKTDAAKAFSLKTVYYKYLAAYEISTIHGQEPPPKEILEDLTAAGGALLTRTVDNYRPMGRRETGHTAHGYSDNSGDEGTPTRDQGGSEDGPGSGSGRVTRGLRQAPPQRVLFQPAEATPRHSRQPQPPTSAVTVPRGASSSYNPSSNPDSMSSTVNNYEPRQQVPLTLRPVTTPGNNAAEFAKRQRHLREQAAAANGRSVAQANTKIMLPGTGFDGPNIYVRCLFALRSGTPAEQDYALHHLVKISMERGDKYRFESFPGLAEALIEKVLEVSSLFYDVKWTISYTDEGLDNPNILSGLRSCPDILQRIASLVPKPFDDNIQPADFSDQLLMINEAALTLRNMVMLEENAFYVSDLHPLRDFLSIAVNLPNFESVIELKHYALEIAEQLTKNMSFEPDDPLYVSLLAQVAQQQDRGAILTSLRAISRTSMNLVETNQLKGIPFPVVENIVNWLLLDDEELLHACLDFLYQYTAVVQNVEAMTEGLLLDNLVNQLIRLLCHGSRKVERFMDVVPGYRTPGPENIPPVPSELMEQLLKLEETERSSQWLRCLFEEDPEEHITQILLWQSYQSAFSQALSERGLNMLAAAEFIKNVSATFLEASAQVQSGPVQKFIIKGIRIRNTPVDFTGRPYSTCKWTINTSGIPGINKECGAYVMGSDQMFEHIMTVHLAATKDESGNFDNCGLGEYSCQWKECTKHPIPTPMKLLHMAAHIKYHLESISKMDAYHNDKKSTPSWYKPGIRNTFVYHDTAKDERHDAAGIPLTAALVIRNLLRTLPKTAANEKAMAVEGAPSLVEKLFKPVEPKMWEIAAHNRTLSTHMNSLLALIADQFYSSRT